MKNLLILVLLGLTTLLISTSCNKDDDDDTIITVESRDKFIGAYDVKDTTYNPNPGYHYSSYVMTIAKDPSDTAKIIITNLNNYGVETLAKVTNNIFMITKQKIGTYYDVSGSGDINGNILKFDLILDDDHEPKQLYGSGVKK